MPNIKLTHYLYLLLVLPSFLSAATLTVTNGNDSGAGSLRNTITSAATGDSIIFAGGVSNVTLTSSIILNKNITINGGTPNVVIGNGTSGLLQTNVGHTLRVRNLRFENVTTTNYSGTALNNAGTLYVYDCTFANLVTDGNGAAIYNGLNATTRIYNSTFQNNYTTGNGGAVTNAGTLFMYDCSLTQNTAAGAEGGAIYNFFNATANANLYNCNFSQNVATGGGAICVRYGSKVNSYGCTYHDNETEAFGEAGAILNDGVVKLYGDSFTGDTAEFFGGAISNYQILELSHYNGVNFSFQGNYSTFLGGAIYNLGTISVTTTTGTPAIFDSNISPYGSAIYNGDGAGNGLCNLAGNLIFQNNTQDIPDGQGGAIFNEAQAQLSITSGVIIQNNYSDNGGGVYNNGGTLTISNVQFNSNQSGKAGAAIYMNGGTLTMNLSTFFDNTSNLFSAATDPLSPLYFQNNTALSVNGTGTISSCTFEQNKINAGDGGALTVNSGTWTFRNCTFSQNIASGFGGAAMTEGGSTTFTHCTIAENTASAGSGMYGTVAPILNNTLVVGNTNDDLGGSITYGSTLGHNLVGVLSGTASLGGVTTGDQTGLSYSQVFGDYTLAYLNGSTVKTYRLPFESLAINAAANTITNDQLGNLRDSLSDVGAYELAIRVYNTSNNTISADDEETGVSGWTHYFDNSGNLLVSIFKNGQTQLGSVYAGDIDVEVGTTSSYGSGAANNLSSATYNVNPNGWYTFNRFWKVNLQNPSQQPTDSVGVRFYYTDADFSDLKTTLNSLIPGSMNVEENITFYKTDGSNDPLGTNVASANINTYSNAAASSTRKWKKGSSLGKKYAEFWVTSFSGGSAGGSPGAPGSFFPVEFLDFTVKQKGENNAILQWSTASELNSDRFVVERSIDGLLFEEVADVPAAGISQTVKNYEFTDMNLDFKKYFYRIKEIDIDGGTSFSNVEIIVLAGKLLMYPNPVKNTLYISTKLTRTPVEVYDINGTMVLYFENTPSRIEMTHLPRGVYYVKVGLDGYKVIKE
ncbi:MAG: T9SS type A sorting domain-containing protein [Bacteroidia bacterium]